MKTQETFQSMPYINFEALAICQHESGSITEFIDNLRIIGHDDRFSRSKAPSPESLANTCSELEEDSDSYDIIDDEPESETVTTKVPNMLSNLGTKNWDDGLKFYGGDPNYNG